MAHSKHLLTTSLLAMIIASGTAAYGQDATAQSGGDGESRFQLDVITVTARRVEETLQDTPISVTAISALELEDRGITQIDGVGDFAPNVNFSSAGTSSGSSSAAVVFIRGVGQNDFIPTTEPGVGIYVDGVYYGRTVGSVLDLLELEQIEVLRGPQGTLFGRNTIGGAINLTTRAPADQFGGRIMATVGSDNQLYLQGAADIPLSDTLGMSVAFMNKTRDGYVTRLDGVDQGDEDVTGGRFSVAWEPSDVFRARFTLDGVQEREESAPEVLLNAQESALFPTFFNNNLFGNGSSDPACAGAGGSDTSNPACYNDQFVLGPYASAEDGPSRSNVDAWGTSLNMEMDVSDNFVLRSITAYRKLDAELARSADGSPFDLFSTEDVYSQNQFSQEIQLNGAAFDDRLNIVSGLYYFNESASNFASVNLVPPTAPLRIGGDVNNENFAVFGEATFDITDRLTILGGLRYSSEDKTYDATSLRGFGGAPTTNILTGDADGVQSRSDDRTTWRLSASYDWTDEVTTYVTASTGFKSGGFTLRLTNPNTVIPQFGPEFVELLEVGLKAEFPSAGLRINAAVFASDYTDIQLDGVVPGAFGTVTFNGGDAEINGVEVEFEWVATGNLKLFGSLGLLDAKYTRLNAGSLVTTNDELIRAPDVTASLGASYYIDLGDMGGLTPRLDITYRGDTQYEPVNAPFAAQEAFAVANFNLGWEPNDDWRLNLGVQNVTDEVYLISADSNPTIGYDLGIFARPRTWSLSVERRF